MPNLIENLENMVDAKKEFRSQQVRMVALPEDYRFVMEKIQQYIWGFASGDGTDMLRVQDGLLELFETSAAEGRFVLDVTGADVAEFCNPIIFLPFISSAFVPTETMPTAVRVFAENQPVTSIVDSIRALFSAQPVGNDIWVALAWCVGISVVAAFFAMRVYRRVS